MQIKKINIIYFLRFFGDALYFSFLALYFQSLNFTSFRLGLLIGIMPICSIVGSFILGKLSKEMRRNLLLIKAILLIELSLMSILGFVQNFYFLLIIDILINLCNQPYYSLQDGIALEVIKKEDKKYVLTRVCGSIGYLLGVSIGGNLIQYFNFATSFIIGSISYAIALVIWFMIEPYQAKKEIVEEKISFISVLKNNQFKLYLVFYFLVLGAHNVGEAYISTYMKSLGLAVSSWGYVFASMILAEIIIMLLSAKFLKPKHYPTILRISAVIICLRLLLLGMNLPLTALIIIAPLRGIGWGSFLAVHLNLVKQMVAEKQATKAVLLLSIVLSITTGVLNYFAPYIFETFSYPILYLSLGIMALFGVIISFLLKFKKSEIKAKESSL